MKKLLFVFSVALLLLTACGNSNQGELVGVRKTNKTFNQPDPYGMVYVYWLMSKIDMQNQEDDRYNVDRAHFENAYNTMSDWWTREHMPLTKIPHFRF